MSLGKVYVGGIPPGLSESELEREFGRFGPLRSVWVARKPPGFGFVEFEDSRDAQDSIRALDGFQGWRVELSRGTRSSRAPPPPPRYRPYDYPPPMGYRHSPPRHSPSPYSRRGRDCSLSPAGYARYDRNRWARSRSSSRDRFHHKGSKKTHRSPTPVRSPARSPARSPIPDRRDDRNHKDRSHSRSYSRSSRQRTPDEGIPVPDAAYEQRGRSLSRHRSNNRSRSPSGRNSPSSEGIRDDSRDRRSVSPAAA